MEARGQSCQQRADCLIRGGGDPSDVKVLAACHQRLQLLGQLVKGNGQPVLAHSVQLGAAEGAAAIDCHCRRRQRVAQLLDICDSLAHG